MTELAKAKKTQQICFAFTHKEESSEQMDEVIADGQQHNHHPLPIHQLPILSPEKHQVSTLRRRLGRIPALQPYRKWKSKSTLST